MVLEEFGYFAWSYWDDLSVRSVWSCLMYLGPISAVSLLSVLAVGVFSNVESYVVFTFVSCCFSVVILQVGLHHVPSLLVGGVDSVSDEEQFVT